MEINIPSNMFVELNNLFKVSTVNVELNNYECKDSEIIGNVRISGDYYQNDFESTLCEFEKLIPFNLVFKERNKVVDNIEIKDFEFFEVEKRGIETNFNIDIITSEVLQDDLEEIKSQITTDIDNQLAEILEVVEDNLPQITKPARRNVKYQSIRVCFFKNEGELNNILKNNDSEFLSNKLNENYYEKSRIIL